MELVGVKLRNFRGYEYIEISLYNSLELIIGKNDIGKSTIFEALDIFFNGSGASAKISSDDLNATARINGESIIEITCVFKVEDDLVCIESVPTDLKSEYLLNAEGEFEVVKSWSINMFAISKCTTSIKTSRPTAIPEDVFAMNLLQLKKRIKDFNLEVNVNLTINRDMRATLYKNYIAIGESNECIEALIPTKSLFGDKDIICNIEKKYPDFYLFKADRKNSMSDDEVQNPMSIAVKRVFEMEQITVLLEQIETIIKEELNQINIATIEKMRKFDSSFANLLRPRISTAWANAIKNDILDDNDIPINKRGSGVRRMLLLSCLMVEAEKKSYVNGNKNIIYAIEEPETSLHPQLQKQFMNELISLSKKSRIEFGDELPDDFCDGKRYKILMTTHLPNFVSMVRSDQVICLSNSEINTTVLESEKIKDYIKNEMGSLPVVQYDYIVFVEGENDVNALKNIGKIKELKDIFDITAEDVNIISLNGSNLLKCIECDFFRDLDVKQYHLYDNDDQKYRTTIESKCNTADNLKVRGRVTDLTEMENYIPISMLEVVLGLDLSDYKDRWQNKDFNIIETLLSLPDTSKKQYNAIKNMPTSNQKQKNDRKIAFKNYLNKTVMVGVTKELLEAHGVYDEIRDWFTEMKNLLDYRDN